MPPKKMLVNWSSYFGPDEASFLDYHKTCESFGTKEYLVKIAEALGVKPLARDTKPIICTKIQSKVSELRSSFATQLPALIAALSALDLEAAKVTPVDLSSLTSVVRRETESLSRGGEIKAPSPKKEATPKPTAPSVKVDDDITKSVMEYLLFKYTKTSDIPTDGDFAKSLGVDKKEIAESYKAVMTIIRTMPYKEDRVKYLQSQLPPPPPPPEPESESDVESEVESESEPEEEKKMPDSPPPPPPVYRTVDVPKKQSPVQPPPEGSFATSLGSTLSVAPAQKQVNKKILDYYTRKGLAPPKGDTDELCEGILDKLEQTEQQKSQISAEIQAYKAKVESILGSKLKEIESAKQKAPSSAEVDALQSEAESLKSALSEILGSYVPPPPPPPTTEGTQTCATLPGWKTGETISASDASSDLLCRDDKVCDVPSGTCKPPGEVSSSAVSVINGYAIPVSPSTVAPTVESQVAKAAATCYTKPIHANEDDLIADLSCVEGSVCDVDKKVCVPRSSLAQEDITSITFSNGKKMDITAGTKSSIVDAIKAEIAMMVGKQTPGPRIIRPINLEQLLNDLKVKRNVSRSSVAEQVRQADAQLIDKIKKCLNL